MSNPTVVKAIAYGNSLELTNIISLALSAVSSFVGLAFLLLETTTH